MDRESTGKRLTLRGGRLILKFLLLKLSLSPALGLRSVRVQRWIKRFGVIGFLFFFVKGMLWLTVPAFLAWKAL